MSRRIAVVLASVASTFVLTTSACDDDQDARHERLGGSCHEQTTCGACTPIVGCGWCFASPGRGAGFCADGPDDCPPDATGWTWDPPGCTGEADGGALGDAGNAGDGSHVFADASVGTGDAAEAHDASGD
jgi:hypothetical protein